MELSRMVMSSYGAETPDNAERWQRQNILNQEENKVGKFKVGDRVKYLGYITSLKGKIGTVICLRDDYYDAGVAFDDSMSFLHDLHGVCNSNHGWYCCDFELKLVDEHRFNVIITSIGDVTTAKLLHGNKLEKEVSVKRYHKDEYSEKAAVEEVCKKLFGEDKPEKEPEPFGINCKAVYIGEPKFGFTKFGFTRGKIYEFSDGRCLDDDGDLRPDLAGDPIINTKSPWFADRFVKIVGEQHE